MHNINPVQQSICEVDLAVQQFYAVKSASVMLSKVHLGCCSRSPSTNSMPDIACVLYRYMRSNSKADREKDAAIMSQGMERTAALLVRPCPLVPAQLFLPQDLWLQEGVHHFACFVSSMSLLRRPNN